MMFGMFGLGWLMMLLVIGVPVLLVILVLGGTAGFFQQRAQSTVSPQGQAVVNSSTASFATSAPAPARYCSHCGAGLQADWTHCPQCGGPVQ